MGIGGGFSDSKKMIFVFQTAFSFWFSSLDSWCHLGPAYLYLGDRSYKLKKKVDCEGDEIGYTLFKKLLKILIDEDGKYNTNNL